MWNWFIATNHCWLFTVQMGIFKSVLKTCNWNAVSIGFWLNVWDWIICGHGRCVWCVYLCACSFDVWKCSAHSLQIPEKKGNKKKRRRALCVPWICKCKSCAVYEIMNSTRCTAERESCKGRFNSKSGLDWFSVLEIGCQNTSNI